MRIGFVGPSYTNRSQAISDEELINLFVQSDESGNAQAKASYYSTPGLKLWKALTGNAVRGEYWSGSRLFAVADGTLYELASDGTATNRGAVSNDAKPVSMAATSTDLFIVAGGSAYNFNLASNTLTDQTSKMLGTPMQCCMCDEYFLVIFQNSQKIQFSNALDGTNWPGLNVVQVSVFEDNLVSILENHREVTVFGSKHGIVYYDSGSDNVFDIVSNSKIEHGNAATFSHCRLDNTDYWIGQDVDGNATAWKLGGGYTPQRVSTFPVEQQWQGYSSIADAESYVIQIGGHTFWHIYFPTANASWRFDVAEGIWHKVGYWNGASYDAHHSRCHVFAFGKHLVGDPTSGNLYEMSMAVKNADGSWAFCDDNGAVIRRLRRTPTLGNELQWQTHSMLLLDVDCGQGPIPGLQGLPSGLQNVILTDQLANQWILTIDDSGDILLTATVGQVTQTLYLNDQVTQQTWQLTVVTSGGVPQIDLSSATYNASIQQSLQMTTADGTLQTGIQIQSGVLETLVTTPVYRGPQLMMRYSNDRGRNWTSELVRDCGQAGEYTKRVVFYRLGKFRNRTYEVTMTDPVPWVIVDGYIDAPVERLTAKMRAQA